jgi:hypothetical protein
VDYGGRQQTVSAYNEAPLSDVAYISMKKFGIGREIDLMTADGKTLELDKTAAQNFLKPDQPLFVKEREHPNNISMSISSIQPEHDEKDAVRNTIAKIPNLSTPKNSNQHEFIAKESTSEEELETLVVHPTTEKRIRASEYTDARTITVSLTDEVTREKVGSW